MTIRPATPEDVPDVLPMVEKICALHESWDADKYGFLPGVARMYKSWLTTRASDERSVFLIAQRDERIVAFVVGTIEREIPIYRLGEYGFIHDLWVEPNYRNEGIGRQLAMTAVESFQQLGVKQIRLDTAALNDPARQLFRQCGFRTSAIEMLLRF